MDDASKFDWPLNKPDAERVLRVLEHHYAYVTIGAQPVTDLIEDLRTRLDRLPQ